MNSPASQAKLARLQKNWQAAEAEAQPQTIMEDDEEEHEGEQVAPKEETEIDGIV